MGLDKKGWWVYTLLNGRVFTLIPLAVINMNSPIYNHPNVALYGDKGYKYEQLQSKEWLEEQLKVKSMRQIAEEVGCKYSGVNFAVRRLGIDLKKIRGGLTPRKNSAIVVVKEPAIHPLYKSKNVSLDRLRELYVVHKLPAYKVAKMLGMTEKTLRAALAYHGIERRLRTKYSNAELRDPEWLKKHYVDDKRSISEIARYLNVGNGAVANALSAGKIILRDSRESAILRDQNRRGPLHPAWRGGKRHTTNGYVMIRNTNHPYATSDGYIMEHRLVMEEVLGRYLELDEIVHHKNGDRKDNRPENLQVTTKLQHYKEHFDAVKKVDSLEEKLARYEKLHGPLPE